MNSFVETKNIAFCAKFARVRIFMYVGVVYVTMVCLCTIGERI